MTWLLVLLILHADGTPEEISRPQPTADACHSLGRAIIAQVNHGEASVAGFRCDVERPAGIEPASPAWKAGALPFGQGR